MLGAFFLFLSVSSSQSFKIMVLCLFCNLLNFQQIQSNKYDLAVLELSHLNCPFKEDQHHHAMAVPFLNFQDNLKLYVCIQSMFTCHRIDTGRNCKWTASTHVQLDRWPVSLYRSDCFPFALQIPSPCCRHPLLMLRPWHQWFLMVYYLLISHFKWAVCTAILEKPHSNHILQNLWRRWKLDSAYRK